jgi:programmed cell death 8 (apoptosis-inducing factor)
VELSFDKCLLATGGRPKNLPTFTEAPANLQEKVSLYRTIPDYQRLDELVGKVESVLVVGGGFLGSELAVGMANRGKP